jgi:hypothetical protein
MRSKLDEVFSATPIENPQEHVRSAIHINGGDLRAELERLPSDIAHYGFEFAKAHRAWIAAKMTVEEVRSAHSLLVREDLEALGEKITEAKVEAKVLALSIVRDAKAVLIETEYEREAMRAVCDALRAKRENLQSLVYLARAEMVGTSSYRDPAGAPE